MRKQHFNTSTSNAFDPDNFDGPVKRNKNNLLGVDIPSQPNEALAR